MLFPRVSAAEKSGASAPYLRVGALSAFAENKVSNPNKRTRYDFFMGDNIELQRYKIIQFRTNGMLLREHTGILSP